MADGKPRAACPVAEKTGHHAQRFVTLPVSARVRMTAMTSAIFSSSSAAGVWTDLLIAGLWAVESYLVQATAFPLAPVAKFTSLYQGFRFLLDLLFCAALALLLPPALLTLALVLDFIYSGLLLAHAAHFRRPPSFYWLLSRERMGCALLPIIVKSLPLTWGLALTTGLLFKVGLAFSMLHLGAVNTPLGSAVPFAGWLGLLWLLQHPLSSFAVRYRALFPAGRLAFAYGFLLQNLVEWWHLPARSAMQHALNDALRRPAATLLPGLPPWPARQHLVVLQLESVGWNAMRHSIRGERVMPGLFALADRSLSWRLPAYHMLGTADMDFALLTGIAPCDDKLGYSIPGLDYGQALPQALHQHGYRTEVLHGNGGDFYARQTNFARMGFDDLLFREELRRYQPKGTMSPFGWCVRDAEVFHVALGRLQGGAQPTFQFIITLDTHTPCTQIEDAEKELFPGSHRLEENYFNSLRVLDRALERFIAQLPEDTLLVLYGDHTLDIHYDDFEPARDAHAEYVPCLVYDKAGGLAPGAGPAQLPDGSAVHINDIVGHLRASLSCSRAQAKV